jgi:hypothetical protein
MTAGPAEEGLIWRYSCQFGVMAAQLMPEDRDNLLTIESSNNDRELNCRTDGAIMN